VSGAHLRLAKWVVFLLPLFFSVKPVFAFDLLSKIVSALDRDTIKVLDNYRAYVSASTASTALRRARLTAGLTYSPAS
jgi:hypothetical protein